MKRHLQTGFTLVEMIIVMVITGIIGGMVAMFIKAPVQGYIDSSRRAEMTDIADTALRRITRDIRTAVPNTVRVTTSGGKVYLEYLEAIGGGRYNTATTPADCLTGGSCTALTTTGNLVTGAVSTSSATLTSGATIVFNTSRVVVYNQYNNSGSNCSASNPSVYCAATNGGAPIITGVVNGATNANQDVISFASSTFLPSGGSPQNRFQIISQPISYVCDTSAGTLTRYWGYAIQPVQPNSTAAAPLSAASHALLATNVSMCNFKYDPTVSSTRTGLVTLNLAITESSSGETPETVSLYSAAHVNNSP